MIDYLDLKVKGVKKWWCQERLNEASLSWDLGFLSPSSRWHTTHCQCSSIGLGCWRCVPVQKLTKGVIVIRNSNSMRANFARNPLWAVGITNVMGITFWSDNMRGITMIRYDSMGSLVCSWYRSDCVFTLKQWACFAPDLLQGNQRDGVDSTLFCTHFQALDRAWRLIGWSLIIVHSLAREEVDKARLDPAELPSIVADLNLCTIFCRWSGRILLHCSTETPKCLTLSYSR